MGVLISLSGVNGIGKSTQVKVIESYLKRKSKRVIVTQQLFQYFFLNPIIKILRPASGNNSGVAVKRNKRLMPKVWFIPAFIDIWMGYLFRVRPLLGRHDYVIADRDYTDMWVSLLYYGFMPDWAFKLLLKVLPRPNFNLLFLAKPETVEKREVGFAKSYYREQMKLYEMLIRKSGNIQINADLPKKTVTREIIRIIESIESKK